VACIEGELHFDGEPGFFLFFFFLFFFFFSSFTPILFLVVFAPDDLRVPPLSAIGLVAGAAFFAAGAAFFAAGAAFFAAGAAFFITGAAFLRTAEVGLVSLVFRLTASLGCGA